MRLRTCVATTSFALLLSALAPAGAAAPAAVPQVAADRAPKAPKVTIKDLVASSEVGRKVKVTGTAKPGKSGRVEVTVQRRYGAERWATVGTVRTTKKGKYALRVPLTQGGPTSFRVKRAGGGKSKVETLAVYEWLDLAEQPFFLGMGGGSVGVTSVVGGRSFPRSLELYTNNLLVVWSVAGCTSVDFWTGFTDRGRAELDPADTVELRYGRVTASSAADGPQVVEDIPIGPAVRRTVPLTSRTTYFTVGLIAQTEASEPSADAVLGTPRVRCNASGLPPLNFGELQLTAPAVR